MRNTNAIAVDHNVSRRSTQGHQQGHVENGLRSPMRTFMQTGRIRVAGRGKYNAVEEFFSKFGLTGENLKL